MNEEIEYEELQIEEIPNEVLELTAYEPSSNSLNPYSQDFNIVAEYDKIDIIKTTKEHKAFAKNFVTKITKLVEDFSDTDLSDNHKSYLKDVGQLQLDNLTDLLTLVDINKGMLTNIVHRINAVQAEDYSLIATYNSLMNQHLKLIKELQNTYKNIPNVLKKMKTEVVTNQELLETKSDVITENYGDTQFNNQKALLKKLREENNI